MIKSIDKVKKFYSDHVKNIDKYRSKVKRFVFGMEAGTGFISKFLIYFMLCVLGFVFLYPVLYMFITSIKGAEDLLDKSVKWIPSEIFLAYNYGTVISEINFGKALYNSVVVSVVPSIINTVICCLTGYGFSRFKFPGKNILFALLLITFIIPKDLISIPTFSWYSQMKLIGSLWTYIIPSTFGQGLYNVIFILIFWSNFNLIPKQLEESAKIDGGNQLTIFFRIALPLVGSALITVFIFSVVWYWNDSSTAALYLNQAGRDNWATLPIMLTRYQNKIFSLTQGGPAMMLYNGIKMAGSLLNIVPLLLLYFSLQRYFIESVERSGIAGE